MEYELENMNSLPWFQEDPPPAYSSSITTIPVPLNARDTSNKSHFWRNNKRVFCVVIILVVLVTVAAIIFWAVSLLSNKTEHPGELSPQPTTCNVTMQTLEA